jgi:hypothetical protein
VEIVRGGEMTLRKDVKDALETEIERLASTAQVCYPESDKRVLELILLSLRNIHASLQK